MSTIKSLYQRFKENFYWSGKLKDWLVVAIAAWLLIAAIVAPDWMWKYIILGVLLIPTIMVIVEFVKILMRE